MAMQFTGSGSWMDFVEEWNKVFKATDNMYVNQNQTMSGEASMRIHNGAWKIKMGE